MDWGKQNGKVCLGNRISIKSLSQNIMHNKINGQIWYRNHADKIQLKEKENLNMVSVMESKKSEIQWKHWMMSFKILNKIYISAWQKFH